MTGARIALVWENFGPSHLDRIAACAAAGMTVTAIELSAVSQDYQWEPVEVSTAKRNTLSPPGRPVRGLRLALKLINAVWRARCDAVFLCHYQTLPVFIAAIVLRLGGRRVVTMIDSKFDDYPRHLWREAGKVLLMAPYHGAIAGSRRSADYLRFLGFGRRPVLGGFDSLDLARIRAAGSSNSAAIHGERNFLIVARLAEKKNLPFALRAFAEWRKGAAHPRKLEIIGYGSEEARLRQLADELGIADAVQFTGKADSAQVYAAMRAALCLILPSTEEQFGLVVIEALALGLPVLVSSNAGAVDDLIDNAVNGWVIDPYRPAALVAAMGLLDRDPAVWQAASAGATASSDRGDVSHFVAAAAALAEPAKAAAKV